LRFLVLPDSLLQKKRHYAERTLLAETPGPQRFFFHLDRETDPPTLDVRVALKEMTQDKADERTKLVLEVGQLLYARVQRRWAVATAGGDLKLPSGTKEKELIRKCSTEIFREAAAGISITPNEWAGVGTACLAFADGSLRRMVPVDDDLQQPPWPVTEPNSASILMFAELALVAASLGIDDDMWEPLLPDLVKMQGYYWGRWKIAKKRRYTAYGVPDPQLLSSVARSKADQDFAAAPTLEDYVAKGLADYVSHMARNGYKEPP